MSTSRPKLDPSQCLNDDCHIENEYWAASDGISDMKMKFVRVLEQARQLKTEVIANRAEIDLLTTREQHQLLQSQESADTARNKIRQQADKLRKYKKENKFLRLANRKLIRDLFVAREDLEKANHLRCGICLTSFQNAVLPCGHGFCRECLTMWLRQPMDIHSTNEPGKGHCPICRLSVSETDVRTIFLEPGSEAAVGRGSDNKVMDTDVISLASDSD